MLWTSHLVSVVAVRSKGKALTPSCHSPLVGLALTCQEYCELHSMEPSVWDVCGCLVPALEFCCAIFDLISHGSSVQCLVQQGQCVSWGLLFPLPCPSELDMPPLLLTRYLHSLISLLGNVFPARSSCKSFKTQLRSFPLGSPLSKLGPR